MIFPYLKFLRNIEHFVPIIKSNITEYQWKESHNIVFVPCSVKLIHLEFPSSLPAQASAPTPGSSSAVELSLIFLPIFPSSSHAPFTPAGFINIKIHKIHTNFQVSTAAVTWRNPFIFRRNSPKSLYFHWFCEIFCKFPFFLSNCVLLSFV